MSAILYVFMALKLSELSTMSEADRDRALTTLVRSAKAPTSGQATKLSADIADFEARYQMSSDDMRTAFRADRIADTADIAKWLLLLRIHERVT